MAKKIILGAAAACAALVGLSATAASADPWWARDRDGGGDYGYYQRGFAVDGLYQREARMADQIRRVGYDGRFNGWEANQAWRGLSDARAQTMREAREHGRFLPADDYYRISARLDGVERFIQREGNDWD